MLLALLSCGQWKEGEAASSYTQGTVQLAASHFSHLLQGKKVNARGMEVPETCRLYSIADHRYGPTDDGQHTTLCVVRVVYRGACACE